MDYDRLNETVLKGTVLTYQCDNEFSLTGPNNIMCTNAGLWSIEPEAIKCVLRTEGIYSIMNNYHYLFYRFYSRHPSTGEAIAISFVITFLVATILGFLTGLLVMHLCSHKKAVYSPATKEQANIGPTLLAGPVYEEVSPKEEIELNTNQAYGPFAL